MPFEKEFSRMTPTPVTANSFVDQTAQEYEGNSYKVTSIINGQEQIYSWDVTFTNQTIEIYSLNWHVEIPEGKTIDGIHMLPKTNATYTFSVKTSPNVQSVYLHWNRAPNSEQLAMEKLDSNTFTISFDYASLKDFYGGFGFRIQAVADGKSRFFPDNKDQRFTTNINNRVRSWLFGAYNADTLSLRYQELYIRWIRDWIQRYGYDGVQIDVACEPFTVSNVQDVRPYLPNDYSELELSHKPQFLSSIKKAIAPHYMVINNGEAYSQLTAYEYACNDTSDAVIYESWFVQRRRDYYSLQNH